MGSNTYFAMDFQELFQLELPVGELVLRGTILYLGILFLMRIMPRRTGGELEVMDLVFILLITEAASHALGDFTSLTDGFIEIGTLMFWSYLVNVLSYYFPAIKKLTAQPPVQVIKDGKLLRRNMRREYLTLDELIAHLRGEGIEDIQKVKKACVESDGTLSVVQYEEK